MPKNHEHGVQQLQVFGDQVDEECVFDTDVILHGKCVQQTSLIKCLDNNSQGIQAEGTAQEVVCH